MEDLEIWLILAASITGIFCFFAIIVCISRKRKHERMITSLITPRYSVQSSRFSALSFSPMDWRWSMDGNSGSRLSSSPIGKDVGRMEAPKVHGTNNIKTHPSGGASLGAMGAVPGPKGKNGVVNGKGQLRKARQSCIHSMTLEMIKEYEEKEQEMGFGVTCEK